MISRNLTETVGILAPRPRGQVHNWGTRKPESWQGLDLQAYYQEQYHMVTP